MLFLNMKTSLLNIKFYSKIFFNKLKYKFNYLNIDFKYTKLKIYNTYIYCKYKK